MCGHKTGRFPLSQVERAKLTKDCGGFHFEYLNDNVKMEIFARIREI